MRPRRPKAFVLAVSILVSVATLTAAGAATPLDAEIRFAGATFNATEFAGVATITLVRSGSPAGLALVEYASTAGTATPGSDYQQVSGSLIVLPTQTGASFDVPLLDDAADEATESVNLSITVSLLGVAGTPDTAVLQIADDDLSGSSISATGGSVREIDGTLVFTVSLSAVATQPVSVSYQTADATALSSSDFVPAAGSVTFAPGVTTQKVAVGVVDDNVAESTETFTLLLHSAVNAAIADPDASGAILDYTTVLGQVAPTATTYVRGGDYMLSNPIVPGNVTADLAAANLLEACAALTPGSLAGKVALIKRGTCTFNTKVGNAQAAGAMAVVLFNNNDGLFSPALTGPNAITVPVVMTTKSLGESLFVQLQLSPITMQVMIP